MYGQLINLLNKEEILKFSREYNGERYVKRFDAYQHCHIWAKKKMIIGNHPKQA